MGAYTGYVHPVADGKYTDLRSYALYCSRAMMALITMRDEPMGVLPPKQFGADTSYYDKALKTAQERLDALAVMTPDQRLAAAEAEWNSRLTDAQRADAAAMEETLRIEAMRNLVAAWTGAPEGLQEFMLKQLDDALAYNSRVGGLASRGTKPDPDKWHQEAFDSAVKAVGRAQEGIAREIALTANRNAWLAQLWASLPEQSE